MIVRLTIRYFHHLVLLSSHINNCQTNIKRFSKCCRGLENDIRNKWPSWNWIRFCMKLSKNIKLVTSQSKFFSSTFYISVYFALQFEWHYLCHADTTSCLFCWSYLYLGCHLPLKHLCRTWRTLNFNFPIFSIYKFWVCFSYSMLFNF